MESGHWSRVEDLFHKAANLAPAERSAFLQRACDGDNELRRELESLLAADVPEEELVQAAIAQAVDHLPSNEGYEPDLTARPMEGRIGPYRIEQEIGRGGMGIVYLASRADGTFRKQFALKLVQYSFGNEELVTRFRREREILGSLDHPHIACLIDAGATEEGLPYYVMEYIEGQPIDRYCDEHRLNITQRINLFRTVCGAVQYAHQNLVVHRDLKPSNILVTGDGTVKLLDFGIAKLLDQPRQETVFAATVVGMRLMTPEYASPEQICGEPVTTATDVYTLGVILYELLTGHKPYRLKSRLLHEIERAICEEEPTRPSLVIAQPDPTVSASTPEELSAVREGTVLRLRKRLSGDIDNILLWPFASSRVLGTTPLSNSTRIFVTTWKACLSPLARVQLYIEPKSSCCGINFPSLPSYCSFTLSLPSRSFFISCIEQPNGNKPLPSRASSLRPASCTELTNSILHRC